MAKGSVRKKGKKWYYRFYVEDASGRLIQKEYVGTESKSETEKLLRQAMDEYDSKKFIATAENITLAELLDNWAEEELKPGSLSNGTVRYYLHTIGRIKKHPISKRKLVSITSEQLQALLDLVTFGGKEGDLDALNNIRGDLRDLRTHYNQLIELAQEFEENENSFFHTDHLRFFRLFSSRVSRLHDIVNSLLDYTNQIRDTYQSRLDVKQNRIMTVLTVVTTVFMPLTLIVGWYGMNFKYMPELDSVWGYPVVIGVSVLIVVVSIVFFKRRKGL